jgi:hypothetical protein
MNHDNLMMISFVEDHMTLKTILLLCDPIIIVNALVSCVTSPKEKFQPSITSTTTGVTFSTNTKLCYRTNSLLMKHADALTWVCKIVDLPPLIVMGNKKQDVSFEDKVEPFQTHNASRSNFGPY